MSNLRIIKGNISKLGGGYIYFQPVYNTMIKCNSSSFTYDIV